MSLWSLQTSRLTRAVSVTFALLLTALLTAAPVAAQRTFVSVRNGAWNVADTWGMAADGFVPPGPSDDLVISQLTQVGVDGSNVRNVTVEAGAHLGDGYCFGGGRMTVLGDLTVRGLSTARVTLRGDLLVSGRLHAIDFRFGGPLPALGDTARQRVAVADTGAIAAQIFSTRPPGGGPPRPIVATGPLRFDKMEVCYADGNQTLWDLAGGTLEMNGHAVYFRDGAAGPVNGTITGVTELIGEVGPTGRSSTIRFGPRYVGRTITLRGRHGMRTVTFDGDLVNEAEVDEGFTGGDGGGTVTVTGDLTNRRGARLVGLGIDFHVGGGFYNEGQFGEGFLTLTGRRRHDAVTPRQPLAGRIRLEDPQAPLGRTLFAFPIASGVQTYDALAARFTAVGGAGLDSVTVEAYGDRAPETFANAAAGVWSVRPFPAQTTTALGALTLRYDEGRLGTHREDSLQVYHSADGQTWLRLSSAANLTRDPAANTVTLQSAPASGLYALSAIETPLPGRPEVVVSVVGPDAIRVGPPNRYLLTYRNAGAVPTGQFLLGIQTESGVYVDAVEPSEPSGVVPTVYGDPADFSPTSDSTRAAFVALSLEPGEERTIALTLKTTRDIEGVRGGPPPGFATSVRALTPGASAAGAFGYARSQAVDRGKGWITDRLGAMVREALDDAIPGAAAREAMREALEAEEEDRTAREGLSGRIIRRGADEILERLPAAGPVGAFNAARDAVDEAFLYALTGLWGSLGSEYEQQAVDLWLTGRRAMTKPVRPVRSWDPNDKSGPEGVGAPGFVADLGRLTYLIRFENLAAAQAPAYEVVISDTLSAALDPETVRFGPTSWPGFVMSRAGNVLTWRATGIELPPNQTPPEGEGWVEFTVEARPGLADGAAVDNRASIVFDINDAILTNTHTNTLDRSAPTTAMAALPAETPGERVVVRWSSADGGSGTYGSTVYTSQDGGPFVPIGTTTADSLAFEGVIGSTYRFFALATDATGNAEAVRPALATTRLIPGVASEGVAGALAFALAGAAPNPSTGRSTVRFSLAEAGEATLDVFDMLGRRVAVLAEGRLDAGAHAVPVDAGRLSAGTYLLRLRQGDRSAVRRLTVVR